MISKETTNGSLHPEDSLVSCGLYVWWGEEEEGGGGEEEEGGRGRDEIEIFTTDQVAVTDKKMDIILLQILMAYYCVQ